MTLFDQGFKTGFWEPPQVVLGLFGRFASAFGLIWKVRKWFRAYFHQGYIGLVPQPFGSKLNHFAPSWRRLKILGPKTAKGHEERKFLSVLSLCSQFLTPKIRV